MDLFKKSNIRILIVTKGQGLNPNEVVKVRDIIAEKFPELENAGIQIQEAQSITAKRDTN